MRFFYGLSVAVLLALVAVWVLRPRPARLDDLSLSAHAALFRLPGVVEVARSGPQRPVRRVVHVLDYHTVLDDLAEADGNDLTELARKVDRVQQEQAELFTHLHRLGVRSVHLEGLIERELPDWRLGLEEAVEREG